MKITKTLLKQLIKEAILSNDGKDFGDYQKKVTTFLEKTVKEAEDLRLEGIELQEFNVAEHPAVGERNRLLLSLGGSVNKLKLAATNILSDLKTKL